MYNWLEYFIIIYVIYIFKKLIRQYKDNQLYFIRKYK